MNIGRVQHPRFVPPSSRQTSRNPSTLHPSSSTNDPFPPIFLFPFPLPSLRNIRSNNTMKRVRRDAWKYRKTMSEEEEEGRRQRGRRSGGRGTREKEARVDSGVMYVGMTSESVGARPPCEYIEAFGRHYGAIRAACRGETLIYTGNYLCLFPPRESSLLPKLYLERGIFPTFLFNRKRDVFRSLFSTK